MCYLLCWRKRGDVPVRVMNVCTEPVVIDKAQSLAEFTEATALDGWIEDQLERVLIFTTQWLT